MTVHPEQAKITFHEDYRYIIRAYGPHAVHGAIFEFGRVLRIEEYLAKEMAKLPITGDSVDMTHFVRKYLCAAGDWRVPAYTYSTFRPAGVFESVSLETVWPIPKTLFRAAERVGWDLNHPKAPIDEVAAVVHQMQEAIVSTDNA